MFFPEKVCSHLSSEGTAGAALEQKEGKAFQARDPEGRGCGEGACVRLRTGRVKEDRDQCDTKLANLDALGAILPCSPCRVCCRPWYKEFIFILSTMRIHFILLLVVTVFFGGCTRVALPLCLLEESFRAGIKMGSKA